MSGKLRLALRRRVVAILAMPLLLASASAATPRHRANADILYYSEQFFTDATYTVQVGAANAYCDGDYVWHWGSPAAYSKIVYRHVCP